MNDLHAEPHVVVIGNVNVDMIMGPLAPWPPPGTEVVVPDYELRVGGSAGNATLALQALGVPMRLLANAGDDVLGRWLRDSFADAAKHWRLADVPTTVSVGVTHPNGERTFLTNAGHLEALGPDDVVPFLAKRAPDGSIALIAGVFLSPPLIAAMPSILAALKAANYAIALDTGWPPSGWTATVRRHLAAWLPEMHALFLNDAELFALSEAVDMTKAVAHVRRMMPDDAALIVKRGPEGASAWCGGEAVTVPAPKVAVADSIGAGDVFNAGFLAADLRGASLAEAIAEGVAFASAVIATRPRRYDRSS